MKKLDAKYWKFWTALTTSSLGDGIRLAALPLIAATVSRDPRAVAAVAFAGQLAWLGLAPISGVLVDRGDRKQIMWTVDALRAVIMTILVYTVYAHDTGIILLCVISFMIGCGETLFDNASLAALQAIAPEDQLETANGRIYVARTIVMEFCGPPIGAFLFVAAMGAPFVVDALSFAAAALVVSSIHGDFAAWPVASAHSFVDEMTEGFRWIWRHQSIRLIAAMEAIGLLVYFAVSSILVLFALEVLHSGISGYAFIFTAGAAGGVTSSLIAGSLTKRIGRMRSLAAAAGAVGVSMALLGSANAVPLALIAAALSGFATMQWNINATSLLQARVPAELFGRVNSVYLWLGACGGTLGAVIGGLSAKAFGLRFPMLAGSAVLALASLLTLPQFLRPEQPAEVSMT